MNSVSPQLIRSFVIDYLAKKKTPGEIDFEKVGDAFDFLSAGVIDSIGLLEMIENMEEHFGITVDFEQMDAEKFTVLGDFSHFVAENAVADVELPQHSRA